MRAYTHTTKFSTKDIETYLGTANMVIKLARYYDEAQKHYCTFYIPGPTVEPRRSLRSVLSPYYEVFALPRSEFCLEYCSCFVDYKQTVSLCFQFFYADTAVLDESLTYKYSLFSIELPLENIECTGAWVVVVPADPQRSGD